MKVWLRWVLIVTQAGGGFTGQYNSLDEAREEETSLLIQQVSRGRKTGSYIRRADIDGEQCPGDDIVSFHYQNNWRYP